MTTDRPAFAPTRKDLPALALLLLLPLVYVNAPLLSLNDIIGYSPSGEIVDIRNQFFYTRFYGFAELSRCHVPLWNPYTFSGMPFVATLQSSMFYPFNLLFAVAPIALAINWSIVCHLFLSGAFTYCLLRHFGSGRLGATLAGIVFTFSAAQVMHLFAGNLSALCAMVWTPLLFLLLDRFTASGRPLWGVLLSGAIACQFLAGQPQYLFYSLIALLFYLPFSAPRAVPGNAGAGALLRKPLLLAAAVALGLALSAVQLLPSAEMTPVSTRDNLSFAWVSLFSFPPQNLITFLIPDFFGDMLQVQYWGRNLLFEMSAYVGIAPLVLAAIAVLKVRSSIVRFFLGMALSSIVLAFGNHTFLLNVLYTLVPGFNLFRGNSKFLILNALAVAVLAGLGADYLLTRRDAARARSRAIALALILAVAGAGSVVYGSLDASWFRRAIDASLSSGEFFSATEPAAARGFESLALSGFRQGLIRAAALAAASLALLLVATRTPRGRRIVVTLFLALVTYDLFSFGTRYVMTFDRRETAWDAGVLAFLQQDQEPFRVIAPAQDLNSGLAAGIGTLSGYDTIMVKRYSEYINVSQGEPPDQPNHWVRIHRTGILTDLLNARYLILPAAAADHSGFEPVFDNGHSRILRNPRAAPRAYVVHAVKVIPERDRVFEELLSPGFDPAATAIVAEAPPAPLASPDTRSPLPRFVAYAAERVALDATLEAPGLLVLGDVWFPGWKAFVDGRETAVYATNYVMRGVFVPAGRHKVEFRYEPWSYRIGWLVTLASLMTVVGLLAWDRRNAVRNRVRGRA
jgi:hypothetical protein